MGLPPLDKYDTVVLGGGGVKCIATLGALQYIYDSDKHLGVHTYIGTSAGAIIGFLMGIGYTPIELITYICTSHIFESIMPLDMMSLVTGNGAIKYVDKIDAPLRKLVSEKIGRTDLTLKELYDTLGVVLVCATYNITHGRCEYLTYKTHPNLECLVAVRMSSSLPLIFDECMYDGSIYIDGGAADNFPITCADPGACVFGVAIFTTYNHNSSNKITTLLRLLISSSSNMYIRRIISLFSEKHALLSIELENVDLLEFDRSNSSKLDLFSKGYNSCVDFFKQLEYLE